MKKALVLLVAGTLSTQAAQIHFALSPPGTDVAVGLSPSNEVPAVTNSSGSGNTIGGGIVFDTDTSILHVEVGYGSAAGFTDLTGEPVAMHIHSPAPAGQEAGILVNLLPYNIATNPAKGGFILGDIPYPTNSVPFLMSGSNYLNIHTVINPGGEIRGQLVQVVVTATNSPPSVTCPPGATAECGAAATATALVSDPDNDALTIEWKLNGASVQTNSLPAGGTSAGTNVVFSEVLSLGTNLIAITVTDSAGNSASCATTVRVVDTTPPVIETVSAKPSVIWPPNHKMVNVRVSAKVTDTCGTTTWKILSVSSNEAADAKGSGKTAPDWKITGAHTLQLRAERAGNGQGRIYTITIQATDQSGNTSEKTVRVSVPHDQSKKKK